MKMGELAAELGRIRLDDMKGFEGITVSREVLWKLLFSYLVNADNREDVPEWLERFYKEISSPKFDWECLAV